jgi:hypothetical protein
VWHDQHGGSKSDMLHTHVNNVVAMVHAGGDETLNSSRWLNRTGAFTDPGRDTWSGTVDYGDGSAPEPLEFQDNGRFRLRHRYLSSGQFVVTVRVIDDDGGVGIAMFTVSAGHAHGGSGHDHAVSNVPGVGHQHKLKKHDKDRLAN